MLKRIILKIITILIIIFIYNYYFHHDCFYFLKPKIDQHIEKIITPSDLDNDKINDYDDIIMGARKEVKNKTKYKSTYYEGGYPPEDEGVCTDVIWRALKNAGFDLKTAVDEDISLNLADYKKILTPDPNIDFRRVKNLKVFFDKKLLKLSLELIPYNAENLSQWQGGDIVLLSDPDHIAIVSDIRRKDGVPYIIHNGFWFAMEQDRLLDWSKSLRIVGHYRFINEFF